MDKENKKIIALGKGGGGGGSTSWGQITGDLANQTDLQDALNAKADSSSIPTATSDLENDSGYITLSDVPAQAQADWNQSDNTQVDFIKNKPTLGTMASESASDYTPTSGLATVATSGSYSDLTNTPTIPAAQIQSDWNQSDNTQLDFIKNKPTIPTVNNSTITLQDDGGTTIDSFTLNQSSNKTITVPTPPTQWFGSQAQFDALPSHDDDTEYYISDKLDYVTDIKNKPDMNLYAKSSEVLSVGGSIVDSMTPVFTTQAAFDLLGNNAPEGDYYIEGTTVQMVVTFTDQTTATYNVVVD